MKLKSIALGLALIVPLSATAATTRLQEALKDISPIEKEEKPQEVLVTEEPEVEVEPKPKRWVGNGFTPNETITLDFLQDYGIEDKVALATILGNIKQESRFHPNICEGGARIQYGSCYRGGYGLIQWTTSFRYWGLGNHAKLNKCDPSQLECQLGYLVTEREWKEALWRFKTPDKSISFYMKGAYRWLGWGIYGNRGYYTQQYIKTLQYI